MRSVRLSLSLFVAVLCVSTASSQVAPWEYFRNTPIPITDFATATSMITVPDNFTVGSVQVMVDIDHPAAADLMITLTDPNGGVHILSQYNGGLDPFNGTPYADFQNTIFDSDPSVNPGVNAIPGVPITAAANSPHFRGIYQPETPLPTAINGAGTWTLEVFDNNLGSTGNLMKWGLIFNRYTSYKDVRVGASLDTWNSDRYPVPFIGDVGTIPPYTVHSMRAQNNAVLGYQIFQNSKMTSTTNIKVDTYEPNGNMVSLAQVENIFPIGWQLNLSALDLNQAGEYEQGVHIMQRADLWQTRDDNTKMAPFIVTPGSLGYDIGVPSPIVDIAASTGECNGAVFTLQSEQTFTSVDIWQSDAVELEPTQIPYATIRVYDVGAGALVNAWGLYRLPKQGNKWVSYPVPPTTLPAGQYLFTICVEQAPFVGSTGFGVDKQGSIFNPDGAFNRYQGFGVQAYSLDGGNTFFEDIETDFTTKLFRPNFIFNNSDVGVICFEFPTSTTLPGTFAPQIRFGSYAHNPHLPNLIAIGKVEVIDNATDQVVRVVEERVFFQPSFFETIVTFPQISGLASGSYTLRASISRADDENEINDVYEREFNVPFGPITVSVDHSVTNADRDKIRMNLEQNGQEVQFVDRTFDDFQFPERGDIIWAGRIDQAEAKQVREFVGRGNFFAVYPTGDRTDIRTEVFGELANSQELEMMNAHLAKSEGVRYADTKVDYSLFDYLKDYAKNGTFFAKDPSQATEAGARLVQTIDAMEDNQSFFSQFGEGVLRPRTRNFTASDEIEVNGSRIGDMSVAIVRSAVAKTGNDVINPADLVNANDFDLAQNYPNPFNPTTTINYNLTTDATITLRVYDMLGREVSSLVNGVQSAGIHTVVWDGTFDTGEAASSGIYFYRMEAAPLDGSNGIVKTKKMMLNR